MTIVKMSEVIKILESYQDPKFLKILFAIYSDNESLLENKAYVMMMYLFDVFRGEYPMKKFCRYLRDYTTAKKGNVAPEKEKQ